MEEALRIIADTNITWGGAFVLVFIIMRPVLLAYIDLAKTRQKTDAELEQGRIGAEHKQTEMLGLLKDELVITRGINNQLIAGVNAIPTSIAVTNRKIDHAHDDVKAIPTEVWRLGDPKLDILKTEFMRYIDSLQETIEDRIDPNALNAREAIRQEFVAITEQLQQIEETLETFKPKTDPPSPKPPKSVPLKRAA